MSTRGTVRRRVYEDQVRLPDDLTIDGARTLLDKAREYGSAEISFERQILTFRLEEEDDWDLRDQLDYLAHEFRSYNVEYEPDKSKIEDGPDGL